MNEKLPRWIFASSTKEFTDTFTSKGISCFVEGDDRKTHTLKQFVEFRMDGPFERRLTRTQSKISIEINILISCARDDKSTHTIHTMAGIVANCFTNQLAIYSYGEEIPELIDCLNLIGELNISHFGQIDPEIPLLQATVEGHYEGIFSN